MRKTIEEYHPQTLAAMSSTSKTPPDASIAMFLSGFSVNEFGWECYAVRPLLAWICPGNYQTALWRTPATCVGTLDCRRWNCARRFRNSVGCKNDSPQGSGLRKLSHPLQTFRSSAISSIESKSAVTNSKSILSG